MSEYYHITREEYFESLHENFEGKEGWLRLNDAQSHILKQDERIKELETLNSGLTTDYHRIKDALDVCTESKVNLNSTVERLNKEKRVLELRLERAKLALELSALDIYEFNNGGGDWSYSERQRMHSRDKEIQIELSALINGTTLTSNTQQSNG